MQHLICLALLALIEPFCASAQTPKEAFAAAHSIVLAHTSDDIYLDHTTETFSATRQMWSASAAFVIAQRNQDPNVSAAALDQSLCRFTSPAAVDCTHARTPQVIALSPSLLLVSPTVGPLSTVFLIGFRNQQLDILWSIDDPQPQPQGIPDDKQLLLEAWLPNRIAADCRDGEHSHPALACGPLTGSIGALPPDSSGHPRFFVDAVYSSPAAAIITKQTSVWTWRGAAATPDWVGTYPLVAGQPGPSFDAARNTFIIPQKGFFRIMADCDSCLTRPLEQRLILGPSNVEDLGLHSLVPEMDTIDEFFWRLAHYESTKGVASLPPTFELRSKVRKATEDALKIGPDFYSIGNVTATVTPTPAGAHVCLVTGTLGPMNVSLRRNEDGNFIITHIAKSAKITCPEGDADSEVARN